MPVRLTATIRSHFSAVMSASGSNDSMPALVTMISTGPSSARTRANAASTDARSATSTVDADRSGVRSLELCCRGNGCRAVEVEHGDAVTVGGELAGGAESDAGRAPGDDRDPTHRAAHRPASTGVNSKCRSVRPRSTQVGA